MQAAQIDFIDMDNSTFFLPIGRLSYIRGDVYPVRLASKITYIVQYSGHFKSYRLE
jgi:hypothetical protein